MTREEIKKVLPVIQAFTEGKIIQTKNGDEHFHQMWSMFETSW